MCEPPSEPGLRASATSVNLAVDRARSRKQVTDADATRFKRSYSAAKTTRNRLSGSYRNELASVIGTLGPYSLLPGASHFLAPTAQGR